MQPEYPFHICRARNGLPPRNRIRRHRRRRLWPMIVASAFVWGTIAAAIAFWRP